MTSAVIILAVFCYSCYICYVLQHFHYVFSLSQLYLVKIALVKTQPRASISEVLFRGLRSTSLVWISEPVISCIEGEAMSLSVSYYCICAFLSHCYSFNPSLCHLSPFLLSYVAVARPCHFSQFYPNRASYVAIPYTIKYEKLSHLVSVY